MEKKILFLILISFNCYAQTIEVKYYENLKVRDSAQFKKLPKNFQIDYKPNTFSYKLITDGKASLFQNDVFNIEIKDEVNEVREVNEAGDTIVSVYQSSGIDLKDKKRYSFKDFKNNKQYEQRFYDETLSIVDSITFFSWRYLNESKIILGYKCKKAVAKFYGIDVYAWFTEEIPISDGPSIFSGLPGLILKIEDAYFEIIAFEVNIKKEPFTEKPPVFKGKVFTYKMLKEYIDNYNNSSKRF
uniref:GLPGLI family protein n=1 Tax=Flavobacterium sp. TaxID=239 RepID=UPI004049D4ED